MTSRARVRKLATAIVVVAAAVLLVPERAHAQFGFGGGGGGLGWGFGMFRPVPSPETLHRIRSRSSMPPTRPNCLRETSTRTTPTPISTTCGITGSSIATASIAERCRRIATHRGAAGAAAPAAAQVPSLPLSSFYNAENVLVWPGDSPMEGDLKEKRAVFDQSSDGRPFGIEEERGRVDGLRDGCAQQAARLRPAGTRVYEGARHAARSPTPSTCSCCRSTNRWPRRSTRRRQPPLRRRQPTAAAVHGMH